MSWSWSQLNCAQVQKSIFLSETQKEQKIFKVWCLFFVHSKADHELKMLEADEHVGKGGGGERRELIHNA